MNETDDPRINRICEILQSLRDEALPRIERTKLERELDMLGQVLDEPREPVYFDLLDLLDWFTKRQATVIPDFNELYRKKAELDRKFLQ